MRKILSTFLICFNIYAAPFAGVKNETATVKTYAQDFTLPNNQATKMAGLDTRIETGNNNLLVNPSFEHSTVGFGWTISNATATADTTNQVDGKKALSLALTGALSVIQDSTINAANLVGLQGNASIKIKTSDVDGLKVCARNAGVTSTSLCVNIPKDGVWKEVNIPNIFTATSNGIAITSTGTTGTVKLDAGNVGTSAPFQGVSGAKLVGTLTYSAATNCKWSTSSSSFADFAANTDCPTPTVTGSLSARATKIPGFTINNALSGTYRIVASGLISRQTNVGQCAYRYYDGTNSSPVGQVGSNSTGIYLPNFEGHITLNTTQPTWNVSLQALSYNGAAGCYVELDSAAFAEELTFAVYYFPPESKIYTQASQDYDWTSYTPTLTGFGTVSGLSAYHKRKGSDLYLRLNFTCGTATATEAQVTLPNSITTSSTIPTLGIFGHGNKTASVTAQYDILAQPSVSYLNFGNQGNINGLTKANGNNMCVSGETLSFFTGPIPIQGWQDYGVIVGSFAGIEKCENSYECTDTFSAQISSTGVVSNENIDWINGNCTNPSTSNYTCTLNTNLKDGVSGLSSLMNCVPTVTGSSVYSWVTANSTTSFSIKTENSPTNASWAIKCQKGTNDYKPKTAKVATSIGVPFVPGISTSGTGNSIDTFSFSYGTTNTTTDCSANPCFVDQIGNAVSSVGWTSAGNMTANFGKTYTKLKCSLVAASSSATNISYTSRMACESCNSLGITTVNGAGSATNTRGTVTCQGSY